MQPYFFPYLGYFGLINHTEKFILFDTVQFIRHGWIERNRILKPMEDWQYIAVPLKKHSQKTLIKDIEINNSIDWKNKIFAQLTHYKKRAPYYNTVMSLIEECFKFQTESITKLNFHILNVICSYLGIIYNCEIFSDMNMLITAESPDEWALNICKALGINEYWNAIGGKTFFDESKYSANNIDIKFYKQNLPFYSQRRGKENFIEGLSIIDVMMFNTPEQIKEMLDDYELI